MATCKSSSNVVEVPFDALLRQFRCAICLCILTDTVCVNACLHRFCRQCFEEALRKCGHQWYVSMTILQSMKRRDENRESSSSPHHIVQLSDTISSLKAPRSRFLIKPIFHDDDSSRRPPPDVQTGNPITKARSEGLCL